MPPKKNTVGGNRSGRSGKPNYERNSVIEAIKTTRPKSSLGWKKTAALSMQLSGEPFLRDSADLKKYFKKKLCNNMRKPTGEAAPPPDVAEAQALYISLENEIEVDVLGDSDSEGSLGKDEAEPLVEDFFPQNTENTSSIETPVSNIPSAAPLTGAVASQVLVSNSLLSKRTLEAPAPANGAALGILEEEPRTKNSRNSGRYSAASALNNLAETISASSSSNAMMNMMQSQMQMQRETMQQMMHMMMILLGNNRSTPTTPNEKEKEKEKEKENK